jgi:hypothetical protein
MLTIDGSIPAEIFCMLLLSVDASIELSDGFGPPGYDGALSCELDDNHKKFILSSF